MSIASLRLTWAFPIDGYRLYHTESRVGRLL